MAVLGSNTETRMTIVECTWTELSANFLKPLYTLPNGPIMHCFISACPLPARDEFMNIFHFFYLHSPSRDKALSHVGCNSEWSKHLSHS